MGSILVAMSFCLLLEKNLAAIILIASFMIVFNFTMGPVVFLYGAEVLDDTALGFVTFSFNINLIVISLITEYLVHWL
jgi:hypothetical protein